MLKLFQDCRKMCHQNKSDLKALFSLVMKCSFLSFAVVKYIRETKVLLGLTTLVACCNVPTSDNISLFVAFFWEQDFYHLSCAGELICWQSDLHMACVKYDTKERQRCCWAFQFICCQRNTKTFAQ